MPFYLAWVYGKGQTFLENLHPNSLPLHMVVLENTTLFFGQFRKGNVSPWDRCGTLFYLFLFALSNLNEATKEMTIYSNLLNKTGKNHFSNLGMRANH